MKTLVFNTFNFPPGFLGPMFSELQDCIDAGENVTYFTCNGGVERCGFNIHALQYQCSMCKYRFNHAKPNVTGNFSTINLPQIISDEDVAQATAFMQANPKINMHTTFNGFEVGAGVLSSYISKIRDMEVVVSENYPAIQRLAYLTILHYLSLKRWIEKNNIQKIILFNGRWDYYRAAFRIGQQLNIPVKVIEVLRPGGYVEKIDNEFPHSTAVRQAMIDDCWQNSPLPLNEKMAIGSKFFERKSKGEEIVDVAYTQLQQKAKLPTNINLTKKVVTIFTSSDDEFVAMGDDYTNPFFPNQSAGVGYVAALYAENFPDTQLVIRMHPNLKGLEFGYINSVKALKGKYVNVFVEYPESEVDSYELMKVSEKIIVFGSSMALEATFAGKPVALLSKTYYSLADVAHFPNSLQDIPALLASDLLPKPVENAIKFGYYYLAGGIKATHFNHEFRKNHFFKTHNLDAIDSFSRTIQKISKYFKITNKNVSF